jgi:protein gp37
MGANTNIEWTDHTFNPWIGCTKISIGERGACVNCYAEVATPARAMHIAWGAGKPRHRTSAGTWALPLRWERNAETFQATQGRRQRIFCASLADVFDNEVDPQWRSDLFGLIRQTPNLDWLLLTKRIGNARTMLPADWNDGYANVWLGATVANQEEADREIVKLIATPARVRFLSCEPLLGALDLTRLELARGAAEPGLRVGGHVVRNIALTLNALRGAASLGWRGVDWVIVGGESGGKARPFVLGHAKDIVRGCKAAGIAVFMKQAGANPVNREGERCPHIRHPKGADMAEWPEELRVREFPRTAA